jgi:DNA-binding NarL/FixJ family response regulator
MINVLIVDDNKWIQDGIKMRLKNSEEIDIIGAVSNGRDAVEFCKKTRPDIVLMDISMPEMDGLEATKLIKKLDPSIKVLILSSYFTQEYLQKAMEYNCNGYIDKGSEMEDFISIIKSVSEGFDVWSGNLAYKKGIVNIKKDEIDNAEIDNLTDLDLKLIELVVKGYKLNEIAKELNYSDCYVRQLTGKLSEKIGVKNTREMAVWGARHGFG